MKTAISELQSMTESDQLYRCRERLEEFHAENSDWPRVMADKWALVSLTQGKVR